VIPILGMYLKECVQRYDRAICTLMFIAALFTITKLWKQPRCQTTEEWTKKMCCVHTIEHFSAIKKNGIILFAGKWMELDIIMLRKISHAQKDKGHIFPHMWKLNL
jgi:hypothetical protein